jgi:hypothetical protein
MSSDAAVRQIEHDSAPHATGRTGDQGGFAIGLLHGFTHAFHHRQWKGANLTSAILSGPPIASIPSPGVNSVRLFDQPRLAVLDAASFQPI